MCTTAGGIKADVVSALVEARANAVRVTIGPKAPSRDGAMRALETPYDIKGLELEPLDDPANADLLVSKYVEELDLPTYPVDVADVHVAVHEDKKGNPKVVFVMNPTPTNVTARVGLGRVRALEDLLPRGREKRRIEAQAGGFAIEVPSRSIRLFAVVDGERTN